MDRADRRIIRHLHVNPEAFAAPGPGQPLPGGKPIIMADSLARLGPGGQPLPTARGASSPSAAGIAVGVQEKRAGRGEGYPPDLRNGAWEYARFNGDGSRNDGPVRACFTCHLQTRAQQDFAFNFRDCVQAR